MENLTVGLGYSFRDEVGAAGPHDKRADTPILIETAPCILGREAFVLMSMASQYHAGSGLVEDAKSRRHALITAVLRAEWGVMPKGENAMRRRHFKVAAQPAKLRRTFGRIDVAVQRNEVPTAQLDTVVASPGLAGAVAEVRKIGRRIVAIIVVVSRNRKGTRPVTPPRRSVAITKLLGGSLRVGEIAESKDSAGMLVQKSRGRPRAQIKPYSEESEEDFGKSCLFAKGDIASRQDDRRFLGRPGKGLQSPDDQNRRRQEEPTTLINRRHAADSMIGEPGSFLNPSFFAQPRETAADGQCRPGQRPVRSTRDSLNRPGVRP